MTFEQAIGYILICLMIGIVYLATRVVCSVKHDNEGIYFITINAWFRGHSGYREWLKANTVYHWLILLVISLIAIILGLIPPFKEGDMLNRPFVVMLFSVPAWFAIYKTYKWLFKKLRMLDPGF